MSEIRNDDGFTLVIFVLVIMASIYTTALHAIQESRIENLEMGNKSYGPAWVAEDDPRWDCATMGNQICGEG